MEGGGGEQILKDTRSSSDSQSEKLKQTKNPLFYIYKDCCFGSV